MTTKVAPMHGSQGPPTSTGPPNQTYVLVLHLIMAPKNPYHRLDYTAQIYRINFGSMTYDSPSIRFLQRMVRSLMLWPWKPKKCVAKPILYSRMFNQVHKPCGLSKVSIFLVKKWYVELGMFFGFIADDTLSFRQSPMLRAHQTSLPDFVAPTICQHREPLRQVLAPRLTFKSRSSVALLDQSRCRQSLPGMSMVRLQLTESNDLERKQATKRKLQWTKKATYQWKLHQMRIRFFYWLNKTTSLHFGWLRKWNTVFWAI